MNTMSVEFENLGLYLKEKRMSARLTQLELAQRLNVHSQYVSNWERGTCAPPSQCFQKALDILKIDRKRIVEVMLLDSKRIIEAKIFEKNSKKRSA